MKRICVFCGSNAGTHPAYRAEAEKLGRLLASRGIELVYGAGNIGLMGAVADACLEAGGTVIGVIPEALMGKEVAGRPVDHRTLTRIEVVDSMHTRKARMAELADGFIALPGGFGTFEEFCEVLTWGQLGFHVKPMGLLNVRGFYDPLLASSTTPSAKVSCARRIGRWCWPTRKSKTCWRAWRTTRQSRSANG